MKYICEKCDYSTDIHCNYEKHLITIKHKQKTTIPTIIQPIRLQSGSNDIVLPPLKYQCSFCGNCYSAANNLAKHKTVCSDKKQLINDYNSTIKDKDSTIKELTNKVSHKDELISFLTAENKNLKTLLGGAGNIVEKSMSTLNYINKNYPTAPALEYITDVTALDDELSEENAAIVILEQYDNGKLIQFIGDIILKNYKKEDPTQQSLWNSDVDRLSYVIRALLKDKNSHWKVDKKGVDVANYIINPILKFMEKKLRAYSRSYKLAKRSDTTNKIMLDVETMKSLGAVLTSIENGSLGDNILKYISPYLYVVKEIPELL